mgnify:CR=1 FL=1
MESEDKVVELVVTDENVVNGLVFASAVDLFAERSFDGASTRDIAARAEVSQPSLAYHFRTKDAIVLEVLRCISVPLVLTMSATSEVSSSLPAIAEVLIGFGLIGPSWSAGWAVPETIVVQPVNSRPRPATAHIDRTFTKRAYPGSRPRTDANSSRRLLQTRAGGCTIPG